MDGAEKKEWKETKDKRKNKWQNANKLARQEKTNLLKSSDLQEGRYP